MKVTKCYKNESLSTDKITLMVQAKTLDQAIEQVRNNLKVYNLVDTGTSSQYMDNGIWRIELAGLRGIK